MENDVDGARGQATKCKLVLVGRLVSSVVHGPQVNPWMRGPLMDLHVGSGTDDD